MAHSVEDIGENDKVILLEDAEGTKMEIDEIRKEPINSVKVSRC